MGLCERRSGLALLRVVMRGFHDADGETWTLGGGLRPEKSRKVKSDEPGSDLGVFMMRKWLGIGGYELLGLTGIDAGGRTKALAETGELVSV